MIKKIIKHIFVLFFFLSSTVLSQSPVLTCKPKKPLSIAEKRTVLVLAQAETPKTTVTEEDEEEDVEEEEPEEEDEDEDEDEEEDEEEDDEEPEEEEEEPEVKKVVKEKVTPPAKKPATQPKPEIPKKEEPKAEVKKEIKVEAEEEEEPEEKEEIDEEEAEEEEPEEVEEAEEEEVEEKEEPEEEEAEEPEEEEEEAEEEEEEGIVSGLGLPGISLPKFLDPTKITQLFEKTVGVIIPKIKSQVQKIVKSIQTAKGYKKIQKDLEKGIFRIPNFGIFKFQPGTQTKERPEDGTVPKFAGVLYDLSGKKIKQIKIGPIQVNKFKAFLIDEGKMPQVECDVTFFKHKGKLIQKKITEEGAWFTLNFKKPFKFPIGLKKKVNIKDFELKLSAEKRLLTSESKLFGTKGEEPSSIKLDLTEPPFTFTVTSKNIPLTAVMDFVKNTPFKKVVLTKVLLKATLAPIAIKISGSADLSKVKIGLPPIKDPAKFNAGIGADGTYFDFLLPQVKLPLKLGVIKNARLRIGPPA